MRIRLLALTGALLLAATTVAQAQTPPGGTTPPEATTPSLGTLDFGFRYTTTTGDEARYERYRDLRTGAFSRLTLGRASETRIWDVQLFNIGYLDQSYGLSYAGGRAKAAALFVSTPLNYSYLTATPWVIS